jgi:hypothetical protein
VGTVDPATPVVEGRDKDLVYRERLKRGTDADDVGNRIKGADLVKVNGFGRHPVNLAFRLRNPLKDAKSMRFDKRRAATLLDQGADLAMRAATAGGRMIVRMMRMFMFIAMFMRMRMFMLMFIGMRMMVVRIVLIGMRSVMVMESVLHAPGIISAAIVVSMICMIPPLILPIFFPMNVAFVNGETHPFDLLPPRALEVHVKRADINLRQFPFQRGRFYSQIAQRANRHVSADPGKAIEEKNAHAD